MAHLLVHGGKIVNVIVHDDTTVSSAWEPPELHELVEYHGAFDIGWTWDGEKAIDPNPPPPAPTETKVL